MKLRAIVETAALASANAIRLIDDGGLSDQEPLYRLWMLSKRRLNGWMPILNRIANENGCTNERERGTNWKQAEPVISEIFATEILTRVWSAILTAVDQNNARQQTAPIASSVFMGHMTARHACLSLMVNEQNDSSESLLVVDRIRRRAERWTDLLLGHVVIRYPEFSLGRFTFDESRAREFGISHLDGGIDDSQSPIWELIFAGLRLSFPDAMSFSAPQAQRNRQISECVIEAFPKQMLYLGGPFEVIGSGASG